MTFPDEIECLDAALYELTKLNDMYSWHTQVTHLVDATEELDEAIAENPGHIRIAKRMALIEKLLRKHASLFREISQHEFPPFNENTDALKKNRDGGC